MLLDIIKYKLFYLYPFRSWINKYLKYLSNRHSKENNLYEKTCQEIADYTQESAEHVKRKHKRGMDEKDESVIFKDQSKLTGENIEKFYSQYSYYIYELPLWNAERARSYYLWQIIKSVIAKNSYKTVLDYGGGAGDLCIELAKHKLGVNYYDISKPLQDFARWRFKKRGLHIDMFDNTAKINNLYDCIVSFDVFEHLKGLPLHIDIISKKIRSGGGLIFSGAFSGGSLHLEENEIYDSFENLDKILSSKGLKFSNKFAQFYFYRKL